MKPEDESRDEAVLSSLLNSTNRDMPLPDNDFLAALRERSTEAFLEAAGSSTAVPISSSASPARIPASRSSSFKGRSMLSLVIKVAWASVAAVVVFAASFWSFFTPHESQVAFGDVLDKVAAAKSLHLTITRDGKASEIWYVQPDLLRQDEADGTYTIARGETMWRVDERQNRAAAEPRGNFGSEASHRHGVDLLALLEVGDPEARATINRQVPVETIARQGRSALHYRIALPGQPDTYIVDAFVDAATQFVESLEIQVERNGQLGPVAEVNVVAVNAAIADEKFVVRDTLTEDGRIGIITDVQGLVSIKPVMHDRWTPVCGKTILKPGDWVRTDNRGANAVTLSIVKQSQFILGPGSLVEVVSPTQVRVHAGEFESTAGENDVLELVGPGKEKVAVKGTALFRVKNDKLVRLENEPKWLKGFKGTADTESLGSLIAKVDGRAVPLTVGYHKVTVDIRDQIARTVVEESFVNHTPTQLEGVFYFPLPDDASISGFGMWIGNELVEADVVEKQRAREIYETILREKRDPGLLEWTGGNIFKARVFPIFGNSEKRIKITYTQVLPARGSSYRYSYALQSELLKLNPLRELSIDVKVNSAVPLKSIASPTHSVRSDKTAHSAHVEFAAQDYTPTRDFEVVIDTDGKQAEVVVVPHRRGSDGYFMLQLAPPAAGDWQRETIADGEPLHVLILADTSASMDAGQRQRQLEVVAALLASMTPRDTINLAGCDVDCDWVFEKSLAAEPKNVDVIRSFLEKRHSLGWTDLDSAFAAAFKQAGAKTHIVYIGDGIVTTGDARPDGFAQRVKQAYREGAGTCHAVAVGSSFEPAVLKAIASLGSGSLRRVTAEDRPQLVATALVREMALPGLRDLKIDFRGWQTARVYPEELANLPLGAQQILLGLYKPTGADQAGEVVVTATQNGKPVKFSAKVALKDAEHGNSFIPRLWAKMHLDSLLAQGAAPSIRDEIIALSEEFQIMTPYTSFLVLENDADRDRFKVKRRFRIRDGEKYFQEGRDNVNFALVQKQMLKAGNWRLGLRRMALTQLATLGRDARVLQFVQSTPRRAGQHGEAWAFSGGSSPESSIGGMGGGMGGARDMDGEDLFSSKLSRFEKDAKAAEFRALESSPSPESGSELSFGWNGKLPEQEATQNSTLEALSAGDLAQKSELEVNDATEDQSMQNADGTKDYIDFIDPLNGPQAAEVHLRKALISNRGRDGRRQLVDSLQDAEGFGLGRAMGLAYGDAIRHDYVGWVGTLFPALPAADSPKKVKLLKTAWPDAPLTLSQSLLRIDKLAELAGGLEIVRESQTFDGRYDEVTSRQGQLDLYAKERWLRRAEADSSQTLVHWADATERGVMGLAFGLGRIRKSTAGDLTPAILDRTDNGGLGLGDHSFAPLHEIYREYTPTLEQRDANRALLILRLARAPKYETRILVDTARHVILSIEQRFEDKLSSLIKFDDFAEAAGSWWARRIETTDGKGRRTALVTQTLQPLAADAFAARFKAEMSPREQVQFVHLPLPGVESAKRSQAAPGRHTFDSHLVLLLHFSRSQQWAKVLEQLKSCEQLAVGKPGVRWLRVAVQAISRRHEELKKQLLEEAALGQRGGWLAAPRAGQADHSPRDDLFVAEHILSQAANVFEANEFMKLLEVLKPVYERQPAYRRALKGWQVRRVSSLQAMGQPDAALREQKLLATEYVHDYNVQQQYAQMLFNDSDFEGAYAWLTKALAGNDQWHEYEAEYLRAAYGNFLQQQGRYSELADFLAKSVEKNPDTSSVYQQYLSALIQADRVEQSESLIAQWLKPGKLAGELTPVATARLSAAISLALGQGYYGTSDRIEEKWLAPLADVALATARSDRDLQPANQIMGHWRYRATDECRRVCREIARMLTVDAARLSPARLNQFIGWIMSNDPAVAAETWKTIARNLEDRWSAEKDSEVRHQLAAPLVQVLTNRVGMPELLAFLRRQLAEGPVQYRAAYANQLFDWLLSQGWSAPYEDEAFGLLARLSEAEEPADRLVVQIAALYRMTDAMVGARNTAGVGQIEHLEQLSRTERRAKLVEQLQLARQGFADRLKQESSKHQGRFGQWLTIERQYLDTQMNRQFATVTTELWESLAALDALPALAIERPAPPDEEEPADSNEETLRRIDLAFRNRCISTLMYLATLHDADAKLVDRLLKYIDKHLAAAPDNRRWKSLKYELLVALDRPNDLKEALTAWMKVDDADSRWRLTLGYLLAELGSVPEAIALFEGVEIADELGPDAYAALAGWYLAANRREAYERARRQVYLTLEEWQMGQWLHQQLNPWQRQDGHLPAELNEEVLIMFSALFEKSGNPQNSLWILQQFYQASHDFRLLAVLSDSVVGHTAAKVYPFVQQMQGVLTEIRDEATADRLRELIVKVRERARTVVDQRALDLLEVQVERRAAEVQNQAGPHVAAALAALKRAFEHEWLEGEQRLMADYLAGLGAISSSPLAHEQLRQMQALFDWQARGTYVRLHVGHRLAEAMRAYYRTTEAIDLLQAALREFQEAHDGRLPVSANNALATLISFLNSQRHFVRAEKILNEQLLHPVYGQQRLWLVQRLYDVYLDALRNDGEVSLGSGKTLYKAFERTLLKALETTDQNHRYNLVNQLCGLYRTAYEKKLSGVGEDLVRFATNIIPEVLTRQTSNYPSLVNQVAATVHDVAGVRAGLAFLIERIEHEPRWFRFTNQDGWSQFAYTLDSWRIELRDLEDLDGRLLKIVLAELRRDLETQQARTRLMYFTYGPDHRFWKEKTDDFARTAEEVYSRLKESGTAVQYIAEYLFNGLGRRGRAIEMLFIANREKILDEAGRSKLVGFLNVENRFGESIALLEPLIEEHPENLNYRVWLMHAYFRTNRKVELAAQLKQTDEHFHKTGQWNEIVLAALAGSCLQNELYDECVTYSQELIRRHAQSQPNRGIGNDTLSTCYANMALAYAGLKQTAKAVDAACGAIVSWGPRHANRTGAIEALKSVLRKSADLTAYAAELDRETASDNEDRPIVRKALGQVLLERGEYPRAIAQLERALAMEPNDVETHQALLACYDKSHNRERAIGQILQTLDVTKHDMALYQNLAERYVAAERPHDAERAYTSIVEALPSESESHALLAEIREKQHRWPEAIIQWEQVARIRELEPTGLIRLAAAQIHEGQWDAARATLRKIDTTTWPPRFNDALRQAREMQKQFETKLKS